MTTGLVRNEDRSSRGDSDFSKSKVNSCIILLFKYTCVPPSAAVARSRDFSSQLPIVRHSLTVHDFA